MFTGLLKQFLRTAAVIATGGSMLLATTTSVLAAPGGGGGGGGANCSITTVPDPASIDEGQSVQFTDSVAGKGPATYTWTFEGGSPDTSSQETVTVSYAVPAGTSGEVSGVVSGWGNGDLSSCRRSTWRRG